jgi:hypothetical protein
MQLALQNRSTSSRSSHNPGGNARRSRKRKAGIRRFLPDAQTRRRWLRAFKRLSPPTQLTIGLALALLLWLSVNWIYQVVRKPSELFFPISGVLYKTPSETWSAYEPIFRKHATSVTFKNMACKVLVRSPYSYASRVSTKIDVL